MLGGNSIAQRQSDLLGNNRCLPYAGSFSVSCSSKNGVSTKFNIFVIRITSEIGIRQDFSGIPAAFPPDFSMT
jgi:hypothetical protein